MFIKKSFSFLLIGLIVVLSAALSLSARAQVEDSMSTTALPEIYVLNLKLDSTNYTQGGEVKGSFTLWNNSTFDAPKVYYLVSLVGKYEGKLATMEYDAVRLGPEYVKGGEKKSINFSYKLPNGIGGKDLGIQVRAVLESGLPRGWSDAKIVVAGESPKLKVIDAYLSYGGKYFFLGEGPTVATGTISLNVVLLNSGSGTVFSHPTITLYDYATGNNILFSTTTSSSWKPNEQRLWSFNLPVTNMKPRVYFGELKFLSDKGALQTQVLPFRYIVYGPMASIQSVSAVWRGSNQLSLTMAYAGTPFNIVTNKEEQSGESDLDIVIYDANKNVIGSYKGKHNFDRGNVRTFTIPVKFSPGLLTAKVIATNHGQVIAEYDSPLNPVKLDKEQPIGKYIFWVLLVLSIILLIVVVRRRVTLVNAIIILFLFVLLSSGFVVIADTIEKGTHFTVTKDHYYTYITVNEPLPTMNPNQPFSFVGTVAAAGCYNSSHKVNIIYDYLGQSGSSSSRGDRQVGCKTIPGGCHGGTDYVRYHDFEIGSYLAPTAAGLYAVNATINNINDGKIKGQLKGYQGFEVLGVCGNGVVDPGEECDAGVNNGKCEALCDAQCKIKPNTCDGNVTCSASPNPANVNDTVTWTANITGGKTPFQEFTWIFDDGTVVGTNPIAKTYNTEGVKTAQFKFKDATGVYSTPVGCTSLVVQNCSIGPWQNDVCGDGANGCPIGQRKQVRTLSGSCGTTANSQCVTDITCQGGGDPYPTSTPPNPCPNPPCDSTSTPPNPCPNPPCPDPGGPTGGFCLKFSSLDGLNKNRVNIIEPQKFPVSKSVKVKACKCSGDDCETCPDCSESDRYPETVEVSAGGDLDTLQSIKDQNCKEEDDVPSIIDVKNGTKNNIKIEALSDADLKVKFPSRCALPNKPSPYNSNPEWDIMFYKGSGSDKVSVPGILKIYFVSSQTSNQ